MTTDRDNFFDNLGKNADPYDDDRHDKNELIAARRAISRLAYEERTIKRAFKESGVKVSGWGRLVNECRANTGKDKLNFDWFNYAFTAFRASHGVLCGARIPKLHKITLADLFKPAGKNRLVRAIERSAPAAPFVFVFPVVRTMFVAHSRPTAPVEDSVALWIAQEPAVVVQPSWSYFQSIGAEWANRA
jgi:hypothetical protein